MADGLARGKRLAGCSALHGVQGILCPVASPSGFRAHVCGGSGLPRGQKQDPPSFVKASAESWYRVPPLPVPSCCLKQRESSGGKGLVQKARSTAELCWPLSGALHALPFQVVDSSVGGGLGPPQHPSCGLLAPRPASPPAALSRRDEGNPRCPGPSKRACYPPTPPSPRTFLWVSWRGM